MEDFAQVFGQYPNDKDKSRSYANIAAVLWVEAGEEAVAEFVRRLVFSVVIGNADMHLKNWSLLYPDRRRPVLSPGYDFVATLPYIPNDTLALSFGGSRSLADSGVFLAWRSGGGLNQWPTDRALPLRNARLESFISRCLAFVRTLARATAQPRCITFDGCRRGHP
jgi:hypothetical protein